jgi:hypothetical protein
MPLITQDDVQNYGTDLLDFTQRAAIQAVSPHLQYLQGENEQLRQRLAQESRARLDAAVEQTIPNFREIDADPAWHRWLLQPDPLTGAIRQQVLDDAIAQGSLSRVQAFFSGFMQEHGGARHAGARPAPRGRSAMPPSGRVYTRDEIKRAYELHRTGKLVGPQWE